MGERQYSSSSYQYLINSFFLSLPLFCLPPSFLFASQCLGYFPDSPWKQTLSQSVSQPASQPVSPAPHQTQSPTVPPPPPPQPAREESRLLPQIWLYNTAARHKVCQKTICTPKVDDRCKSGVCITDCEIRENQAHALSSQIRTRWASSDSTHWITDAFSIFLIFPPPPT